MLAFLAQLLQKLKALELPSTFVVTGLNNWSNYPRPLHTLWFLFWPFPWKFRPFPALDSVQIFQNPLLFEHRYYKEENYRILRSLPLFHLRDTPLFALYRLHDAICAACENGAMMEGAYIWHRADWPVRDFPDPQDPDPIRYAVLTSIAEDMAKAFNRKIRIGLRRGIRHISADMARANFAAKDIDKPFEEAPPWAANVPALPEWVFLEKGNVVNPKRINPFAKRRIMSIVALQLRNIYVYPRSLLW
ncbi:hypothetical protein AGABI2DRAFT_118409 [Agaricus bisporus var. bisporus H97]|uniref:hypothetical protein n=1 Tax=Agaricus bisporus var. bisporus (strain H97 / ATCC MYA-4626 / FGSC 10389) TaxID=936046 RepID=UPI00029F565E|nr:hypothetical protein AGABI2DRAFT_118409 [Agaricus bisporus var. bisporus H97]EKV46205.1 hypothetical protein AGABI2DRAFT_118409 [Agaricus bisporus var. bisporus H97]